MNDLISRKAAIKEIESLYDIYVGEGSHKVINHAVEGVESLPAVESERTEPPKAERINTAREMIEAEIKGNESDPYGGSYLDGLNFAIDCLDKPAEQMVSVAEVERAFSNACESGNAGMAVASFSMWLDERTNK